MWTVHNYQFMGLNCFQRSCFAIHDVATNHNILWYERVILYKVNCFEYGSFGVIKSMKP